MGVKSTPSTDDKTSLWSGEDGDGHDRSEAENLVSNEHEESERARTAVLGQLLIIYVKYLVKAPCCFVCLYLTLFIVLIIGMWRGMEIEKDFSALIRADGESLRNNDALLLALENQRGATSRRLSGSGSTEENISRPEPEPWKLWFAHTLQFIYKANAGNALDKQVLGEVRDFEKSLRSLPKWQEFCVARAFRPRNVWTCDPGESLTPFLWASQIQPNNLTGDHMFDFRFDGEGSDLTPFNVMFRHMRERESLDASRRVDKFFPEEWDMDAYLNGTGAPPDRIRSSFSFYIGVSYAGWTPLQVRSAVNSVGKEVEKFFHNEVHATMERFLEEERHMQIFYDCRYLADLDIKLTLDSDLLLSAGSIIFVTLWMWYQMKSLLLSAACFLVTFGSLPLAFVFTPAERTTIAFLSAVFLITIIDIDVIFIFINFWIHSRSTNKSIEKRTRWTIKTAGASCMATSLTTSVSFFSNLVSSLQPLREFGLFMGLCVMGVYVLAVLLLPPLMILEHQSTVWRERRRQARTEKYVGNLSIEDGGLSIVPTEGTALKELTDVPALQTTHEPPEHPKSEPAMLEDGRTLDLIPEPDKNRKISINFVMNMDSFSYKLLFYLVDVVSRWAWTLFFLTLLSVVLFIWGILTSLEVDLAEPKLFPPDHNHNMVKSLLKEFETLVPLRPYARPQVSGSACNASRFISTEESEEQCLFHWCDADSSAWDSSTAACFRTQTTITQSQTNQTSIGYGSDSCSVLKLRNRIASGALAHTHLDTATMQTLEDDFHDIFLTIMSDASGKDFSRRRQFKPLWKKLEPLAQESWESGTVKTKNFYESDMIEILDAKGSAPCVINTMCFAQMPRCSLGPEWISLGNFDMPTQVRINESRRLATDREAPARRLAGCAGCTLVHIVWGIKVPLSAPIVGPQDWRWDFDSRFQLSNPWAQRAIYNTCQSASTRPQLRIRTQVCWIANFRLWLNNTKQQRFPSRTFDADVIDWFWQAYESEKKQVWFEDGKVVASQVQFWTDLPRMSSDQVLRRKELWNEWLTSINLEASVTANKAWHVSHRWVSAEANDAIINSTLLTIFLEILIGWICILVFTGDPILAMIVLSLVVINICGLAFCMTYVFKWALGPIEVICLVVFVGYSVTFGLHVSGSYARVREYDPDLVLHYQMSQEMKQYNICCFWKAFRRHKVGQLDDPGVAKTLAELTEREKRIGRTRIAVLQVGGAIINAAFSSVATSIFLQLCTLTIFNKIGAVVLTITTMSVAVTLISLPAALIVCGPNFNPCYKRCFQRCASSSQKETFE